MKACRIFSLSTLLSFILLVSILSIGCQNKKNTNFNDTIEVYNNFKELENHIKQYSDGIIVMNFWATSCPPCIKEMPHFNSIQSDKRHKNIKVVLISLDKPSDLTKRVIPFVEKHHILPEVCLLGDENYSAWTEKIDSSWYGALPATLVRKGNKRTFRFGMYQNLNELLSDIEKVKN